MAMTHDWMNLQLVEPMLIAQPLSFFSIDWNVEGAESGPVELIYRAFSEQGEIATDPHGYEITKLGVFSGKWEMRRDGKEIALASKTSAFFRRIEIISDHGEYLIEAKGPFSTKFILWKDGSEMGMIQRKHFFSRSAVMDCSNEVPEHIQLFCLWLTLLMWRRDSNSKKT
jgi:hypothetical protein